jgi:ADP-ribose pyrophosphatase YjhB (NUDIX family)
MNKPKAGTKKLRRSQFEFSAGGVVQDGDRLLMVKVENLEGRQLWTFPKGHIEPGEKATDAALREVEEETGYRCQIVGPLDRVQYYFQRNGTLTKKTVTWFLMTPQEKTGTHDREEIMETEWVSLEEAGKRATYKSDKTLLAKLKK